VKILINKSRTVHGINRNIYGHFAEHLGRCIYEGIWVGEDSEIAHLRGIRQDVVAALKELSIPVLRWPGGCFADEYHWKDGIGPRDGRKKTINSHWGGVIESNQFGTHEFFDLCEMLDCAAYVNGNLGSGTVAEMNEWVEYITFDGDSTMAELRRENGRDKPWRLDFFGVGNENWACGGHMRPEFYADLYRQYQTYVRARGVYKVACGANSDDYNWTRVLMERAAGHMHGLSLHYYSLPTGNWQDKGDATGFPAEQWHDLIKTTRRMDELIARHSAIMDQYDPDKKIGLLVDEWGTWYNQEPGSFPGFLYQQNSIRDAMVAAINLHIFHKHADRVTMANIAQTINVLQAMILTDGAKMLLTPTYHVFEMLKHHQDGHLLDAFETDAPEHISQSASIKNGEITISICNHSLDALERLEYIFDSDIAVKEAHILAADKMDAHNTFDAPNQVAKKPFADFTANNATLLVNIPPMSVCRLIIR